MLFVFSSEKSLIEIAENNNIEVSQPILTILQKICEIECRCVSVDQIFDCTRLINNI